MSARAKSSLRTPGAGQRPQWWYAWQSRHGGDAYGLGATCRWATQIATWQQRGYDARTFCSNPRICGWNYIHTACKYYAQEEHVKDILFAQYEHIAMGHMLLKKMSLIIGDELPIRAFLHPWHIPAGAIVPPDMEPGPIADLVQRLRTLVLVPKVTWSGPELLDALGGAGTCCRPVSAFRDTLSFAAYEPELRSVDGVEDVPYFHLPVADAPAPSRGRARAAGQAEHQPRARRFVRPDPAAAPRAARAAAHVIWLDATANAGLYETLFRRPVQVVRPEVAFTGRVRQVWAGLNNKMGLSGEGTRDSAKMDHMQQQIARILSRGYSPRLYQLQGSGGDVRPCWHA
jgi:hypothetical protein